MCCGNKRNELASRGGRAASPAWRLTPASGPGASLNFKYNGSSSLTIIGSVTGKRYHFSGRGDVQPVDPLDGRIMHRMPALQQVR